MPTVRTTMRPDEPIEVGNVEYLDLQRQGLLVEDTAADESVPPATAASTAKKTTTTAKSD